MKKIKVLLFAGIMFSLVMTGTVQAHHALEFIEVESYTTAPQGGKLFHLHYDYYVPAEGDATQDHWELTPGFGYGIFDRLMFDIHTHFAKFGTDHNIKDSTEMSPMMEAVAMTLQYRLSEPGQLPVDVAASLTYECPFSQSVEYLGGTQSWLLKLIVSRSFGVHSNICLNLGFGVDDYTTMVSEWALGVKAPLTDDPNGPAAGIELLGDYAGGLAALPGIYYPINDNSIIKMGISVGNAGSDYLRASVSLMNRF